MEYKRSYCENKEQRHTKFPTRKVREAFNGYNLPWKCSRCGSLLKPDLVIHHKNGNRADNSKENLEILCYNCHKIIHGKKFKIKIPHIAINITIPQTVLADVEKYFQAKNRSRKLTACLQEGINKVKEGNPT